MKDSISSAIIISVVFLSGTLGHYIHEKAEVNLEEKLDTVAADDKYHKVPKFTKKWERQGEVEDKTFWYKRAQDDLSNKLSEVRIEARAKNLIMFIGDGMGLSTVVATRIYKGQLDDLPFGEEGHLYMESFPYIGTSKTYCSNWQVADSACSSTAYSCGTKGNAITIGVTPTVTYNNCTLQMDKENHVSSLLSWAQDNGMSTGIVTTTTVTHASPAGSYAHVANRLYESDLRVENNGADPDTCDDIGEQLMLQSPGKDITVILGGGREHLTPNTVEDAENPGLMGHRKDGKNFPVDWLAAKTEANKVARYVTLRDELLTLNFESTEYLLGLFAPSNMGYVDQQAGNNDPSLEEMTEAAIKILSKNPAGYFLFVEGGRIDHGHHDNFAHVAIKETLEFDRAIQLADAVTKDEETLIVISSDHSHMLTIAGDPPRGNPILGFTGNEDNSDGLPATTLAYTNGDGYRDGVWQAEEGKCRRADLSDEDSQSMTFKQPSLYPRDSATHSGEDVLIFAKGPFAHLFTGIHEQSYIPHAMAYAACISPFENNFCSLGQAN